MVRKDASCKCCVLWFQNEHFSFLKIITTALLKWSAKFIHNKYSALSTYITLTGTNGTIHMFKIKYCKYFTILEV